MKPLLVITLLLLVAASFRCSSPVAGGSSDHGNGKVCGIVVKPNGDPAAGTSMMLLPDTLNYALDSVNDCRFEFFTDSLGRFQLDSLPYGIYCLSGKDAWSGNMFKKRAVAVSKEPMDIGTIDLSRPGTIYFDIDSMGIAQGTILYFPGLPLCHVVDSSRIQWINNVPAGPVEIRGYVPANDSVFDLGIEYLLEVLPGRSLFLPYRLSKPWHVVDSATAQQELDGIAGITYRFSALKPPEYPSGPCRYRFSWGDGAISAWSEFCRAEYAWEKPGRYYVQTQLMVNDETVLAWSEAIVVVIAEAGQDE
ncbi:MAG: hypothetical protein JW913_20480 [Chitinispirillaceae bacterium]|nr:hypothetical protein [Chitinispirillaceae bacterium]